MQEVRPVVRDRGAHWAMRVLRLFGWSVRYDGTPPGCGVVIAYPHTSNWDFVVGILAKWSMGIPVIFLAKDSLFRVPLLGRFVRRVGGLPVDRSQSHGLIGSLSSRIKLAQERGERWWLAITPEGTRKRQDAWRTGFYHIAVQAGLPIGLAYFNFSKREIGLTHFLMPTGDLEADMREIADWYAACAHGCRPALATPVRTAAASTTFAPAGNDPAPTADNHA